MKWRNADVERQFYWEKLRPFLKANGIKYEPSDCFGMVHVEIYCDSSQASEINSLLGEM